MTDRFEKFTIAISEISRYWHKIAGDVMEEYDLKATHAIYLTVLQQYKNGITSTALCNICGKDKSDVSRLISIMEAKGLVVKEGGGNYRALLKLTDSGKELAELVKKKASAAVEIAGKDLSQENRRIFYEALGTITTNLRKISKTGLPE